MNRFRPRTPASQEGKDPLAEARRRALASLGRSDRSSESLRRRLAEWGFESEVIEQVVTDLVAENWLCDERYATHRAEAGVRKGWGPRRLQQDLHGQGIDSELSAQSLEHLDVDWDEQAVRLAAQAVRRGKTPEQVARWLAGRGFKGESIRRALRSVADSPTPLA